jgi:5,10-methylene-tetrahydrofolate dehydrogenase/methenyl tetrahydrofolate cyclohydrolase
MSRIDPSGRQFQILTIVNSYTREALAIVLRTNFMVKSGAVVIDVGINRLEDGTGH